MTTPGDSHELQAMRNLSPLRRSTQAADAAALAAEQLAHFHIAADSEYGQTLSRIVRHLYAASGDLDHLWRITTEAIDSLDRSDRIAWFNAKKFLSFQIAKLLDTLQNPFRRTYQSLDYSLSTQSAKGPYAIFDNVTAIFSATPVIARTATYVYACADWVAEAVAGKEFLEQIYSRLLNPTSLSLANYIVDLEAGPYTREYLAWNFGSGMAAIDAALAHVLGQGDVLITSRNLYGGAHQLIHDWYAKPSNLGIAVEHFQGLAVADFDEVWTKVRQKYADRLCLAPSPSTGEGRGEGAVSTSSSRRHAYVYLESPCNPHGYVLDVPGICNAAHAPGLRVLLDATVGTPLPRASFQRFFDSLDPTFAHMISLGQSNTIVSCPGLTTHSELDETAQQEAGISRTTIRFAVGDEDPHDLLAHLI